MNMSKPNIMKRFFLISAAALLAACNKDDVVRIEAGREPQPPTIETGSETDTFVLKTGGTLRIEPTYTNVENATYSWKIDGRLLSTEPVFVHTFEEAGDFLIELRVVNPDGETAAYMKAQVSDLAPPVISLAVPPGGLTVAAGRKYEFRPDVQNADNATFRWTLDGKEVGSEKDYTFLQTETGTYALSLCAENEDGSDSKDITVEVVGSMPVRITWLTPSFYTVEATATVALGRSVWLEPIVEDAYKPVFSWSIDGEPVEGAAGTTLKFTPGREGVYNVKFTVTDRDEESSAITRNVVACGEGEAVLDITVVCCPEEGTYRRPADGSASARWNRVYEYLPAPGQFINEPNTGGFSGESTQQAAIAYAEDRMGGETPIWVSLGGFGGYITVGFDHSIDNSAGYKGGYNFSIQGNQLEGSSEPGIVWVMQDTNGNGLPDDTWYELKGSEYGKPETIRNYAVTYYRPAGAAMDVQWTDNLGNAGSIDYLAAYHAQDSYYPLWIEPDAYTLYGTRLEPRVTQNPTTGHWYNGEYEWGYADNFGSDRLSDGQNSVAAACKTYFKISNAVNPDGSPADLQYIDFVKVQTAVNFKAGWLGENSSEVCAFVDENMNQGKK